MLGHLVEVTPTVDTSAYATGDRLGSVMTLEGVNVDGGKICVLENVVIVDKAKQGAALDILFFDESPTVASADNAAIDITDAEMADKALGFISIAEADYIDLANSSLGTKIQEVVLRPKKDSKLYALAVSRGTPTYGAASDLVFKFTFSWGR